MTTLDEAVDLLKDMVPILIDDDSLCDTLAAAVSGSNGAFSSLQLVHRLTKMGILPISKVGCALRVHQRASGHVNAATPRQVASPRVSQVASPRASQAASPRAAVVASTSGEGNPASLAASLAASASPSTKAMPMSALSGSQLEFVQRAMQQLSEPSSPSSPCGKAQWRSPCQSSSPSSLRPAKRPSLGNTTLDSADDLPQNARVVGKIPSDPTVRDAQQAPDRALGVGALPVLSAVVGAPAVAPPTTAALLTSANEMVDVSELMDESMASLLLDDAVSFKSDHSCDALDKSNLSSDVSLSDGLVSQVLACDA